MESPSVGAASLSGIHRPVAVALTTPENAAERRELRHYPWRQHWRSGATAGAIRGGTYQDKHHAWRQGQRQAWCPPPPLAPPPAPPPAPRGPTAASVGRERVFGRIPVDGAAAVLIQWCDPTLLLQTRRSPMVETTSAPTAYFTTGQVSRLTGLTHRQLDHWAWSGFLTPRSEKDASGAFARRRYTFEDLVRIRTVAELRRQGAPLQLVRKAAERLQQFAVDPLRRLKLVVHDGEVYVYRNWADLERATDGQLAFTFVDVGAVLRQLEGQVATLGPPAQPPAGRQTAKTPSSAAG